MKFGLFLKSKTLKSLASVLCALVATSVFSVALAADAAPKVIASLSAAATDELWGGAERIADVMKYGDFVKGIRGVVNLQIKTNQFDSSKPFGAIVATDGNEVVAFGYLPLAKPEEIDESALAAMKERAANAFKGALGEGNEFAADFFVLNGALIVGKESQKDLIAAIPADAFAAPSEDGTTLTKLILNVDAAPKEFVEAGASLLRQRLAELVDDENEDELSSIDRALANYSELVASVKSLQWRLAIDADSNLVSRLTVTPKRGGDLAASMTKTAQTKTRWSAVAETPNLILSSVTAGDSSFMNLKGDAESVRRSIHDNIISALDVLKDEPENYELAKEVAGHVENALVADIESDSYDSGVAISSDPFAVVLAGTLAAPGELQAAVEKLVERLRKENDSFGELTKEDVEGYAVQSLTVALDDVSNEIPDFFSGKKLGVKLGFSSDAMILVATLDPETTASIFERVARGSHETAPQPNESFFDVAELAKALLSVFSTLDNVAPEALKSIESFANAENARIVAVTSYNDGVYESTTTIQNGFFKTLGDVLRINLASGGGNGDEGQDLDELFDEEE